MARRNEVLNTTRLRRSTRASASKAVALTIQQRYEKLITYVLEPGTATPTVRQFVMPNNVLASMANFDRGDQALSSFETLPGEVLLEVMNLLCGNDQIMLALSSKTLAHIVEISPTRKIANISWYNLGRNDPANHYDLTKEEARKLGFMTELYYCPWSAPSWQHENLKVHVEGWLGTGFALCGPCKKFRSTEEQWWQDFAEHENPGVLNGGSAKAKVNKAIDTWSTTVKDKAHSVCPAHALLAQRKGLRSR